MVIPPFTQYMKKLEKLHEQEATKKEQFCHLSYVRGKLEA